MPENLTPEERACKCDLRTRLVGDGCQVCNPDLAAEIEADYYDSFCDWCKAPIKECTCDGGTADV